MKDYTVWMNVTEVWKVWFKAENMEQAKEIIAKLETGDIDPDDIENYRGVNKGIDTEYALDTLEEFDFVIDISDNGGED